MKYACNVNILMKDAKTTLTLYNLPQASKKLFYGKYVELDICKFTFTMFSCRPLWPVMFWYLASFVAEIHKAGWKS
jgi:hypothetical protein